MSLAADAPVIASAARIAAAAVYDVASPAGNTIRSGYTRPVTYEPSDRRWLRVHANRSVAVAKSPIAAYASAASAVSDAVIHGSSETHRMPSPSIANVVHPSPSRILASSPTIAPVSTG